MKRILDFIDNVPITKFISSIFILAMAVIMVIGGSPEMPESMFQSVRTLTANIAMGAMELQGDTELALIASGTVLFVFAFLLNFSFSFLNFVIRQHDV